MTGKAYYEYATFMGKVTQIVGQVTQFDLAFTAAPGYDSYKDDDKGQWYTPVCPWDNWPDPNDTVGWDAFASAFEDNHPWVFVAVDQTPPAPVPPEVLRKVASDRATPPLPHLDWNPKRQGSDGTLVNLETWFWLANSPPTTLTARAVAGNAEASVTATFDGMEIAAPGERSILCPGIGTPYTTDARQSDCVLAFSHASSALGGVSTPVTVKTMWSGTWTENGGPRQALVPPPLPRIDTFDVVVDEVQTLVTDAR